MFALSVRPAGPSQRKLTWLIIKYLLACKAIHEYNDAFPDVFRETEYGQFLDSLAEKFDTYSRSGNTGISKPPVEEAVTKAEQLLSDILEG